jgi:hypothetical protein
MFQGKINEAAIRVEDSIKSLGATRICRALRLVGPLNSIASYLRCKRFAHNAVRPYGKPCAKLFGATMAANPDMDPRTALYKAINTTFAKQLALPKGVGHRRIGVSPR